MYKINTEDSVKGGRKEAGWLGTTRPRSDPALVSLVFPVLLMQRSGYWGSWQPKKHQQKQAKMESQEKSALSSHRPGKRATQQDRQL